MQKNSVYQRGYFYLKSGFPDEYYAFTDGEVSLTVERNGGINTLGCLDIFEKNGKLYPDRSMTPAIFLREGNNCGKRPLYGPAVQFISRQKADKKCAVKNIFHVPDRVMLYPFGFESASNRCNVKTTYDLIIDGKNLLFRFTNASSLRDEFIIAINKEHIYNGKMGTLKNQVTEGGDKQTNPPFEESIRTWEQKWEVKCDTDNNAFLMKTIMRFSYCEKPICVFLTANRMIRFEQNDNRYFLIMKWHDIPENYANQKDIRLCLSICGNQNECMERSNDILLNIDEIIKQKTDENTVYAGATTNMRAEKFPEVQAFANTAPSFMKAMVLAETEKEACIRAAAHKYGFFNLWDQVWPAKGFLLMGDRDTAKKLLRYPLITIEGTENKYEYIYLACFLIAIAEDIIAVSGDISFRDEVYDDLKRIFLAYTKRMHENGFLDAAGACGVDDPKEIGITGKVFPACLNSLWYDACRAMENIALSKNDTDTAEKAGETASLINTNYPDTFFDVENGYLYSSIDINSLNPIRVYQNVATLGMDFIYGEYLLRNQLDNIAKFQAEQLYHPAGRSAVPQWGTSHEMWKNVIMYQHIAHEMRTVRSANLSKEIKRMMKVYLGHYKRNKVAIETHNLTGADGDISQRANWQAFGARALYSGIFESLIGIQCHSGGFCYIPADFNENMAISGFAFRNALWDINIKGKGKYTESIIIDDKVIKGTLQIPEEYLRDTCRHKLSITRTTSPFSQPTILYTVGSGIKDIISDDDTLFFTISNHSHITCKLFSPKKPKIRLNGENIEFEWQKNKNIAWIDMIIQPNSRISVS